MRRSACRAVVLTALAFIVLEILTLTRLFPPLFFTTCLLAALPTTLRAPLALTAVLSVPDSVLEQPYVELALLSLVLLPLWLYGAWVSPLRRTWILYIPYGLQGAALGWEVWERLYK